MPLSRAQQSPAVWCHSSRSSIQRDRDAGVRSTGFMCVIIQEQGGWDHCRYRQAG